nr:CP52k-like protein 1 [Chthamalus malayensis]
MLRVLVLTWLAAAAAGCRFKSCHPPHPHPHPLPHPRPHPLPRPYPRPFPRPHPYPRPLPITDPAWVILRGLLPRKHYRLALKLVLPRYPGLDRDGAAYVIRYLLTHRRLPIFGRVKYHTVPALPLRLAFIRKVWPLLPPVFYRGKYHASLLSYLRRLHFPHKYSYLIRPLSLLDFHLACHFYRPVSKLKFNKFFVRYILRFNGKVFPPLPRPSKLFDLFDRYPIKRYTHVFRHIHGHPLKVRVTELPLNEETLPLVLSRLGLPKFYRPHTSLAGLLRVLKSASISQHRFVAHLRQLQGQLQRLIHRLTKQYSGLRRDLLKLCALRYYAFPLRIRRNVHFHDVFRRYLSSIKVPTVYTKYTPTYVYRFIIRFERYVRTHALKKYSGKLWWSTG